MKVSVIIATYNGERKISTILKQLNVQSYKNFEVIIVNDGSTDSTLLYLRTFQNNFSIQILNQKNSGRAHARNAGVQLANGDLLLFYDDDMRPSVDNIEKHVFFHQKYPNSIITGSADTDPAFATTEILRFKVWLENKWRSGVEKEQKISKENPFLTAANLSIPISIFKTLDGFQSSLKDAEDLELAIRALNKNIPIYYIPELNAWHDDNISMYTYIKRLIEYKKSHEVLLSYYPHFKEQYLRFQIKKTGLKQVFYYFLANTTFIRWIDKEHWIIKLMPTTIRYKLIEHIIWAFAYFYPERLKLNKKEQT